jgi:hypothetical protein
MSVALLARVLSILVGSARADDGEIWVGAFVQAAPSANPAVPRLWLDLHDRRNAAGSLAIVRPGIGWQLGPGLSVWAGYAWVPTLPDEADMTQEHRVWQQVSGQWPVGPVTVSLRLREEQRVRVGAEGLQHRLRVAPRVGVKIAGPVSVQVWDEVFLSWNETEWFPVRGYDQNRFFVGPGIEGMRGFRTEIGYLNHDLARGADSANNHALALNLLFSLGPPGR